ncbi:transmembrane protein 176B-like [Dendropsophus ebraccatus]|uniref:transmembrane protein 176B-like n=1 Tax=Dendropsophus ebraccatus TaxID=150705 RepID=UPI00383161FB
MTATSTVKTKDGNVSCETAEGTVVHININQRSAFDCLLDTFKLFRQMKKSGPKTETSRVTGPAAYLGFGVAYISLGLVSVMLAIIIQVVQPRWTIFYLGLHFWVGFPFLVSGALNLLSFKYPNKVWRIFAFIFLLGNLGVSIAGLVFTAADVDRLRWWSDSEDVCNNLRNGRRNYWDPTPAPRYQDDYQYDYNLDICKSELQSAKNLQAGLIIMTLLLMIWALCLSLFNVGCRLRSCCRSCTLPRTEEEDDAPVVKPNLSDDIIIA